MSKTNWFAMKFPKNVVISCDIFKIRDDFPTWNLFCFSKVWRYGANEMCLHA